MSNQRAPDLNFQSSFMVRGLEWRGKSQTNKNVHEHTRRNIKPDLGQKCQTHEHGYCSFYICISFVLCACVFSAPNAFSTCFMFLLTEVGAARPEELGHQRWPSRQNPSTSQSEHLALSNGQELWKQHETERASFNSAL